MLENVRPDGTFDFSVTDGRVYNPGHAIEAGWFLLDYARRISACDPMGSGLILFVSARLSLRVDLTQCCVP